MDEDPDQHGHEVPAEALEGSSNVLHLKDLSGALEKKFQAFVSKTTNANSNP